MTEKNAFVLLHFGDKIKYFELELYFVQMLRKYSNSDLIYLYLEDTPQYFIETMQKYFTKCIPVKNIALKATHHNFKSWYSHFNTLTTCNFIHGYNLTRYTRICIVESDMIITRGIDDIFTLPAPSILFINETAPYIINPAGKEVNGGIMLFKPSRYYFRKAISLLPGIIADNSKYPNEELFLRLYPRIYTLPQRYNYCHYGLSKLNSNIFPTIVHFNETKWKYVDIIKDKYINKFIEKKRIIDFFKVNFYDKYVDSINDILANYRRYDDAK